MKRGRSAVRRPAATESAVYAAFSVPAWAEPGEAKTDYAADVLVPAGLTAKAAPVPVDTSAVCAGRTAANCMFLS